MRQSRSADLVQALTPVIEKTAPEELRILLAVLERIAAERYRRWAAESGDAVERGELLRCARREEEIASTLEGMDAEAERVSSGLQMRFPGLRELYGSVFVGQSRARQFEIQAAGELGGAALLRRFAAEEGDPARRKCLRDLAPLEEENTAALRSLLG